MSESEENAREAERRYRVRREWVVTGALAVTSVASALLLWSASLGATSFLMVLLRILALVGGGASLATMVFQRRDRGQLLISAETAMALALEKPERQRHLEGMSRDELVKVLLTVANAANTAEAAYTSKAANTAEASDTSDTSDTSGL